MISQLATVAIKASVRVSPATVEPKLVIRSKSRSRLFSSEVASAASWALATAGSRSVLRTNTVAPPRFGSSVTGGFDSSNRAVGFSILPASSTFANSAETT